jgi:hypothetical protein
MKPGDLVILCDYHLCNVSSDAKSMLGLIIRPLSGYDRPHYQVLWSSGDLLIEDTTDLRKVDEESELWPK